MRVTLKMIAQRAGVHISTVDKVIHDRGGVSKEVADNIRSIIEELGYRPNPAGRALQRSSRTYRIRVLMQEVDAQPYIEEGIRAELAGVDFNVEAEFRTTSFLDVEGQAALLEEAVREGADGVILLPINSRKVEEAVDLAGKKKIPVITVDSDLRRSTRLCHVGQNPVKGARIAGRMMGLFLRGEGKAAVITNSLDPELFHDQVKTRETEFIAFLHGNYPDIRIVRIVEGFEDREKTYTESVKLLREEPELQGIFIACGGVDVVGQAIREAGREMQTSVVSFEEYPEILDLIRDQIVDCTIACDLQEMGRNCVRLMMEYLVYGNRPEEKQFFMDEKILVKESL